MNALEYDCINFIENIARLKIIPNPESTLRQIIKNANSILGHPQYKKHREERHQNVN